jgi:hypothetical protein
MGSNISSSSPDHCPLIAIRWIDEYSAKGSLKSKLKPNSENAEFRRRKKMKTLQFTESSRNMERSLSIEPFHPAEKPQETHFKVKLKIVNLSEHPEPEREHSVNLDSVSYANFIEIMRVGRQDDYPIGTQYDQDHVWISVIKCDTCKRREVIITIQFIDDACITQSIDFTFESAALAKFNILAEPHYVEALLH